MKYTIDKMNSETIMMRHWSLQKQLTLQSTQLKKYAPKDFNEADVEDFVKVYSGWKNSTLNPEPQFKKVASLRPLWEI